MDCEVIHLAFVFGRGVLQFLPLFTVLCKERFLFVKMTRFGFLFYTQMKEQESGSGPHAERMALRQATRNQDVPRLLASQIPGVHLFWWGPPS